MLDLDALRSFIAFVDTGSFTLAAQQIHKTQSAISMQMKKLERTSQQTLFVKKGRNLVLTDQGHQLASYARQILSLHDTALLKLQSAQQLPDLVIGCPSDYVQSILPKIIQVIRQQHPSTNITIICENSSVLREMLNSNIIHLAVLSSAVQREEGYLLQHEVGYWVHGGYPELLELDELPLILYQAGCKFRTTALDGLEKQHQRYKIVCSSSNAGVIQALLTKGLGISALASATVTADLTIINDPRLPTLPSVDIILKPAGEGHPILTDRAIVALCSGYHELKNNTQTQKRGPKPSF